MKNQLTLKNIFYKLWIEISEWFTSSRYFNEDSFVTRLRYFQITAFSFLFITSFLNFLGNLMASYFITSITCVLLIAVRYLMDNNRIKEAYAFMLCSLNTCLILLTYVEGLRSGVILFFFPSIISFSFLAAPFNKKNTQITYLISIGSFFIAFFAAPDSVINRGNVTTTSVENALVNIILSFSLIVWMSYNLVKENSRKQSLLCNKEVFLNTIFNSSLHTEIVADVESGLVSSCNNRAASLFGVASVETLHQQSVFNFFPQTKEGQGAVFTKFFYCNDSNWEGELNCMRVDGTIFPASVSVAPFIYHEKNYKKITIVDITEKNNILKELQAAKKKAEEYAFIKSQFLSHMSHELRTPLNGIIGSTNLLLGDKFLEEQKDHLNILKFSSEHMLSLINDILDLSKLEADRIELEKAAVDIPELIHKISSPFLSQFEDKGVSFEVEVDENLKRSVLADPTRLNQVLTNLLSNAFKFTSKGQVKLEVKGTSVRSDFNTIEFNVYDTGIGISEDKKNQIFDQFTQADVKTTRKYGGTGLGLTISRKLVGLMGGSLKVESKYHRGSRFYFEITLPVYNSRKKAYIGDADTFSADNKKLKGIKVLIAEDNPINMMIASKFLDKWGVSYKKAKNGLEAVSLFEENRFDLLLMDLEMPEMDGYNALNEIRKLNTNIPAIAFTAAVFDNMKESLITSGFNDYIQKPFRPQDLQAKLLSLSTGLVKSA